MVLIIDGSQLWVCVYELWRPATDGADELAHAQDWTAPNTCHTQNKEIEEKTNS